MRSLFISVHFDDAIFSCGKLIAIQDEPMILTIYGGEPENKSICTAYDQKSGFSSAEEALEARRNENEIAATAIGASHKYYNFTDNQYGEKKRNTDIEYYIKQEIEEYDEIYIPLGIQHPDHETIGMLCQKIIKDFPEKKFYVFMDMPYYVDNPERSVDRLREVKQRLQYQYRGGDFGKKMASIMCYKSQLSIMNIYHLMVDERYYLVIQ